MEDEDLDLGAGDGVAAGNPGAGAQDDDGGQPSAQEALRAARLEGMIDRVAAGRSYPQIAREFNVATRTVQRAMVDADVARRVAGRRRQMTSEASGRLTEACAEAVTALVAGLGEERAGDRLRAAQLILSQTTRFRTMEELEARIIELEARLDGMDEAAGT